MPKPALITNELIDKINTLIPKSSVDAFTLHSLEKQAKDLMPHDPASARAILAYLALLGQDFPKTEDHLRVLRRYPYSEVTDMVPLLYLNMNNITSAISVVTDFGNLSEDVRLKTYWAAGMITEALALCSDNSVHDALEKEDMTPPEIMNILEKAHLREDDLQSAIRIFNDVLNHRGIRSYRLNITLSDDDELPPLIYEKFCSADVKGVQDAQKACLRALARGASDAVLDTMMFRVSPME